MLPCRSTMEELTALTYLLPTHPLEPAPPNYSYSQKSNPHPMKGVETICIQP